MDLAGAGRIKPPARDKWNSPRELWDGNISHRRRQMRAMTRHTVLAVRDGHPDASDARWHSRTVRRKRRMKIYLYFPANVEAVQGHLIIE